MRSQVTILAAGMGTRLGQPFPKPLTPLRDGRTIMEQQFENIKKYLPEARIQVVVGFKFEQVIESQPDAVFIYNKDFANTNTSKSLLRSLRASAPGGMLWFNGDVVFDARILERLIPLMQQEQSFVAVNTATVGEEEVKYTVDESGNIAELSKTVQDALGEAVGINYVSATDKDALIRHLTDVDDQDYFERGIELAIEHDDLKFNPIDISDLYAIEVDFKDDLQAANEQLESRS